MATPGRPRQSAIPGPGRLSSIPTPGRSRSSSSVYQNHSAVPDDISQAFADAIKANDPSQHRMVPPNISSTTSLSPQSISHSLSSGRRSVAGRPSSSASTSSTKIQERAKTPISARISTRPPSRQSEIMTKAPKFFDVGENVRIESLGFEGTLRYVGEIESKSGLWAGVELSGGFAGKGKNDGTVGGKQYFSCPNKCGVFVATTKLSAPTVGPGVGPRPSSVASSRGGRSTPANSGRTTPSNLSTSRTPSTSFSNGRVTPSVGSRSTNAISNGRITPNTIGSLRPRPFKTPTSKPTTTILTEKITEGSRASKYMTMTAQQLNSRDREVGADSPTRKNHSFGSSPTLSRTLSSPTRTSGSPFTTPKALNGRTSNIAASPSLPSLRGRPSMNTPRARIPSGIAMPPPPSPKPLQSHSPGSMSETNGTSGQVKNYTSGSLYSLSRPGSSASSRSTGHDDLSVLEQLRSRLDAVEYENERLRSAAEVATESSPTVENEFECLRVEHRKTREKCSSLESKLSDFESRMRAQTAQIETLESDNKALLVQLEQSTTEVEKSVAARKAIAREHSIELEVLQERINEFAILNGQRDITDQANVSKITELEQHLAKAQSNVEEDRRELGAQIDELRIAGQETIALYEERLSAANDLRYELEHRISTLENSLDAVTSEGQAQQSSTHVGSFATQIDNETLRDQVQHLQKKSAKLEEQLEDTRAALERDVTSYQDKISRVRLEDEQTKRDLAFKTREVEQLLKSEAAARNRIDEIEEALRESTVALENARGDIEIFRAEIANLDVLIDDASEDDISSKLANFTKRASADKARYHQDISRLETIVLEMRAENEVLLAGNVSMSSNASSELQAMLNSANEDNDQLREQVMVLQGKLFELTKVLDVRTIELESVRKKSNRDVPVSTSGIDQSRSISSKSDSPTAREEVAGLKHIVQDLQKENVALTQQIKLMESENQLLLTETEQLRQEVHILEDNLDNSLHESGAAKEMLPSPVKSAERTSLDTEQTLRLESDMDQMRKRLNEMEMKHARSVHDLNKEISELEALVESKIYREDELEQEVEKLKDKLSRHKKSSKNGADGIADSSRHRLSTASSVSSAHSENLRAPEVCEICERPGHDIFNCSLLKEDAGGQVICEDCESPGHVAADCPHSQEVF